MTPLPPILGPAGRATCLFYVAVFAMLGAHIPFWPLWLADWGLSEAEIGAWLSLAIAARVASGLAAPWLADLTGQRRAALAILALSGVAVFAAHGAAESRGLLLALTLLSALSLGGVIPIGDALASAAADRFGFAYAQARAMGSAAFLAANLLCGALIAHWGPEAARWWIIASAAALAWFSLRHPGGGARDDPRPSLREMAQAMTRRDMALAALASAAIQGAHAPLYAYGSIQWRAQGIGEAQIGALWAVGVAVETALMFLFGARMARRLGAGGCFALAALVSVLRWGLMATAPDGALLWALQISHALTFMPAHLGLIAFVGAALPPALAASGQGLASACIGAATALATVAAGAIYPAHGPMAFLIGAPCALIGLGAALALRRRG